MKEENNPFCEAYDCTGTVDCMDCNLYPESNPGLGKYMYDTAMSEPGKNNVFPLVCDNGIFYYLALYVFIWNGDKIVVDRSIVRPGYRLSSEDEEWFYLYCTYELESDPGMFETFMDNIYKVFPMMDDNYSPDQIGLLMRHAYWCAQLNTVNPSQWQYILCLLSDDGCQLAEYEVFSTSIYEYLGRFGNPELAARYKRYRTLRSQLNNESGIKVNTPLPAHIETVNRLIETALKYYSDSYIWTHDIVKARNEKAYVYSQGEYIVLMPSVYDVIKDAFAQHQYLLNYLDSYINGNIRILLLRKCSSMNEPFTAFVIIDRSIESILGPSGRLPEADVFKWLEGYAKNYALDYRPDEIINERLIEDFEGHEGYSNEHFNSLIEYAKQFRLEHAGEEE